MKIGKVERLRVDAVIQPDVSSGSAVLEGGAAQGYTRLWT